MRDAGDAYRTLHVERTASDDSIRRAYRLLARRYHPDGLEPDPRRMVEINVAHDQLKTRERRESYDAARRPPVAVGPGVTNNSVGASRAGPLARRRAVNSPDGGIVVDFGQYAGWRIGEIAQHDPEYLRWLSRHSTGVRYRAAIERCLPGDRDLGRRSAWVR